MNPPPQTWQQAISCQHTPLAWWQSWEGDPNDSTHGGPTPLLFAAWDGNAPLMRLLLNKGADPHRTHEGKTLAELAVESRNREAILLSLSVCEDLDFLLGSEKSILTTARPLGVEALLEETLRSERRRRRLQVAKDMEHVLPGATQDVQQDRGRL